ncbi:MAG: ribosome small subunit-dependent GTPase A [Euzebya sp.]
MTKADPIATDAPGGLTGLGWDQEWAGAFAAAVADIASAGDGLVGDTARPGRILSTHRVGFDAVTPSGREFVIHRADRRDPLAAPATGDWVVIADVADVGDPVITTVLPRRTALVRRDPADRAAPQVLAAGIDVVAVVHGADRPVNVRRLERQLVVAHGSGAEVLIIITKCDLPQTTEVRLALGRAAPGQDVLVTAASQGVGIDRVDALTAAGRTVALLGESGAGKSTLVNAVLGYEELATGGVRGGDSKGRHTTTRRELLALPSGGALLDTPGVRAIALWPGFADLDAVFGEISRVADQCRFANCTHQAEPDCGVRVGVDDGSISADRLQAWLGLHAELHDTRTQLQRKAWR